MPRVALRESTTSFDFAHNLLVVVVGVVGNDQNAVVLTEVFERRALHLQIVFASASDEWEVGVVVADLGSFFLQQLDNRQRRRFAQIVNILLVGNAQHQNLRAIDRFFLAVQAEMVDAITW